MKKRVSVCMAVAGSLMGLIACNQSEQQSNYYCHNLSVGYTGTAPKLDLHGDFSGELIDRNKNLFSPDPLVHARWAKIDTLDKLELYELYPAVATSDSPLLFEGMESLTTNNPSVKVMGAGEIRLDFGVESPAWLEFESPDFSGEVELSISEYTQPGTVNAGAQNPRKTKAPVRYGNTYRLELNSELYEGVRFGWIHVRKFDKPFTISKVRLVCQTKPVNYEGSFACSDSMLNRIWYTGAYTVRTNLLYDYFGAILMERSDRHSWTGDAYPIQATAMTAFGNWDHVRQNIDFNAHRSNGIESYPLLWVQGVVEYYYRTGELDLLQKYTQNIAGKLDHGYAIFDDPAGVALNFLGHDERLGACFENPQNPLNARNYQFLWIRVALNFAEALRESGNAELAARYEKMTKEKYAEVSARPDFLSGLDIHAAAEAVNTGLLTAEQEAKLVAEVYANRLHRVSFSPFNQYFIMQSLGRLGRYDMAMETVDDCWGSEVRYGATTFCEVFNPSWASVLAPNAPLPHAQSGYVSLCHPWSGGVTAWLSEEVLGVSPLSPGFKEAMVRPNPGDLKWVKGTVPTPNGAIGVDYRCAENQLTVTVPNGVTAHVVIPKRGGTISEVTSANGVCWKTGYKEDDRYVYLPAVTSGEHRFMIQGTPTKSVGTTAGSPAAVSQSAASELQYAITLKSDTRTDWNQGVLTYGSDGYLLYGAGDDMYKLPSYIADVKLCDNNRYMTWEPRRGAFTDSIAMDQKGVSTRIPVGFVATNNPAACQQTLTVDVTRAEPTTYLLTLYMVDGTENKALRPQRVGMKTDKAILQNINIETEEFTDTSEVCQAVEIYDLGNRSLLSPLHVVSDFRGGAFVTYQIDRDVRARIYHISGHQAVLSGVLFTQP